MNIRSVEEYRRSYEGLLGNLGYVKSYREKFRGNLQSEFRYRLEESRALRLWGKALGVVMAGLLGVAFWQGERVLHDDALNEVRVPPVAAAAAGFTEATGGLIDAGYALAGSPKQIVINRREGLRTVSNSSVPSSSHAAEILKRVDESLDPTGWQYEGRVGELARELSEAPRDGDHSSTVEELAGLAQMSHLEDKRAKRVADDYRKDPNANRALAILAGGGALGAGVGGAILVAQGNFNLGLANQSRRELDEVEAIDREQEPQRASV